MRFTFLCLLVAATTCAACNGSSTAPSTTTTTTTTVASPTTTDYFAGAVDVGGTTAFPFTVGTYGTVNATLVDISGTRIPSTVQVRLGIGTLDDSGVCTASTFLLTRAGTTAQVTATEQPGTYCVNVADVGNLVGPANFDLAVAHP